jgi:hypothetical protein
MDPGDDRCVYSKALILKGAKAASVC